MALVVGRTPLVGLRVAVLGGQLGRRPQVLFDRGLPPEGVLRLHAAEVGGADSREPDADVDDRAGGPHDVAAGRGDGPVPGSALDLLIRTADTGADRDPD